MKVGILVGDVYPQVAVNRVLGTQMPLALVPVAAYQATIEIPQWMVDLARTGTSQAMDFIIEKTLSELVLRGGSNAVDILFSDTTSPLATAMVVAAVCRQGIPMTLVQVNANSSQRLPLSEAIDSLMR